jgi:hypothetical protein
MTTYNNFKVPYGTTVTRLMTDTERKHAQRLKHASFVLSELLLINANHKLDPIYVKFYGTPLVFTMDADTSTLKQTYSSAHTRNDTNPHTGMEGRYTTVKMFANWNPTVCARILKLAKKQVADRRSQTAKKYSPFSDTIEYHESFA